MDTGHKQKCKNNTTTKCGSDSDTPNSGKSHTPSESLKYKATIDYENNLDKIKNVLNDKWQESERSKTNNRLNANKECIKYCNKYFNNTNCKNPTKIKNVNLSNELLPNSINSLHYLKLHNNVDDCESEKDIYRGYHQPILCISNKTFVNQITKLCSVINNQELLYHIEKKHANLQKHYRKIIELRLKLKQDQLKQKELCMEIEKQRELWDNSIREFKNKHYSNTDLVNSHVPKDKTCSFTHASNDNRHSWNSSAFYMNFLNQIYSCTSLSDSEAVALSNKRQEIKMERSLCRIKQNNSICQPTCCRAQMFVVDDEGSNKEQYSDESCKNTRVQEYNSVNESADFSDKNIKISNNSSFASIENKLDVLIKSVYTFLTEIKEFKSLNPKFANAIKIETDVSDILDQNTLNNNESTGIVQMLNQYESSNIVSSGKILIEEIKKANVNEFECDKGNSMLNANLNYVCKENTILVPATLTKEISTEITKSLAKTEAKIERELVGTSCQAQESQRTVAVNTDLHGIIYLLRISSDIIKKWLSSMSNMSISSCCEQILSYLRIMHTFHTKTKCKCKSCGANSARSVKLREHEVKIQDSEPAGDCCVCCHILDGKNNRAGDFTCLYCGLHFTRAYCCELHQLSCAKAHGRKHDAKPNLVYLK